MLRKVRSDSMANHQQSLNLHDIRASGHEITCNHVINHVIPQPTVAILPEAALPDLLVGCRFQGVEHGCAAADALVATPMSGNRPSEQ